MGEDSGLFCGADSVQFGVELDYCVDRQRDGDVLCVQVFRICAYEDSGGDGSGKFFGVRYVSVGSFYQKTARKPLALAMGMNGQYSLVLL